MRWVDSRRPHRRMRVEKPALVRRGRLSLGRRRRHRAVAAVFRSFSGVNVILVVAFIDVVVIVFVVFVIVIDSMALAEFGVVRVGSFDQVALLFSRSLRRWRR